MVAVVVVVVAVVMVVTVAVAVAVTVAVPKVFLEWSFYGVKELFSVYSFILCKL